MALFCSISLYASKFVQSGSPANRSTVFEASIKACIANCSVMLEEDFFSRSSAYFFSASRSSSPREGFFPSENLHRALTGATKKVESIDYFSSLFGEVLKNNDTKIVQTELAETFKVISSEGANGFYMGEIAS